MLFHYQKRSEKVLLFQKKKKKHKKSLWTFFIFLFFSCGAIFDLELMHENV